MIDTTLVYYNEEGVGNAVKKSGIKRSGLFTVDKARLSYLDEIDDDLIKKLIKEPYQLVFNKLLKKLRERYE